MNSPLVYCNGDSYSNENYHASLKGRTYDFVVAEFVNGFSINKAISGSCNRRIIRSTVHDLIQQRQLNPGQKIIALIGLTFDLRSELWIDELSNDLSAEESNYRAYTFTSQLNWRENLLSGTDIQAKNNYNQHAKFFKKVIDGRAFFFSPYAERINLLTDLIMLKALSDTLDIDLLVFQSPVAEKLQPEYLVDFFKRQIVNDDRFFDLEDFGFLTWCNEQGFIPLDFLDRPTIGHYGADAHSAFANKILIPRLQKLGVI
jgi:hypothetical protein